MGRAKPKLGFWESSPVEVNNLPYVYDRNVWGDPPYSWGDNILNVGYLEPNCPFINAGTDLYRKHDNYRQDLLKCGLVEPNTPADSNDVPGMPRCLKNKIPIGPK
jgi:hypothetical protein